MVEQIESRREKTEANRIVEMLQQFNWKIGYMHNGLKISEIKQKLTRNPQELQIL